ncbi:MAG: efflux RND transporter periplasmic adaptor subunit [Ignavibacteriales bacterium]|nr:efflux RND transporter periplasmic adaptor subunit [Ignavibacteriota bacterium]MCB9249379.1 efflux RND transporter periplasmic adaptor subunit [Ignavibacteriales bacterium]
MKIIGLILMSFLLVFVAGCSDNQPKSETIQSEEHNEAEEHTEGIKLSDEVLQEFGIEVKEAGPGVIKNHIDLTGEIKAEPSKISHIVPRFAGIVQHVNKTVGERVSKGEVLAVIESNESLTTYEVTSLIDGTIIEMHMTQGELIGTEAHAFTIADLDKVWAILSVYQKDINKIKVGQNAKVSIGSIDNDEIGKISYLSPIVDEKTRTASARVILNNRSGKWRPGMFITAKAYVSESKAQVVIEKTALQSIDDGPVVFVKDGEGFVPKSVKVGKENDDNVEILTGLKPGQQYVAKGAFTLKAEVLKESFGGGHGH